MVDYTRFNNIQLSDSEDDEKEKKSKVGNVIIYYR